MDSQLITAHRLSKKYEFSRSIFSRKKTLIYAVSDVTLSIKRGEICGVVGESGCGKSTLGRLLLRLEEPTSGTVFFKGEDIRTFKDNLLNSFRRRAQIIFQDPYSSLNPRQPVGSAIEEGLIIHNIGSKSDRKKLVEETAEIVGLRKEYLRLYPHELSGGQRQRVCIARALVLQPEFVVCDEPLSALDVSIQAQIINLLLDLQEHYQLTYMFISHDLSVIKHLADRVVVMYLGYIVEEAPKDELFFNPLHPYTQELIKAVPVHHPSLRKKPISITKEFLQFPLQEVIKGCPFEPRCTFKREECQTMTPDLVEVSKGHFLRCFGYNPQF